MNKFDYNKPRNGGYPFTNVNGHTPENSLDFLDWTRRNGITFDVPFKYDKVRNGGYPFTNINGYTPSKSTKFLNWTRRDDNDEPVPPGPQAPNYLKYSSATPFEFAPVEWAEDSDEPVPIRQNTPRWDGILQYHVGSEPDDNTVWTDFPSNEDGGACDWVPAEESDGNYNVYIRGINNTIVGTEGTIFFHTQVAEDDDDQTISLSGKLMALFDYNNPESATLPDEYFGVQYLFDDDWYLTDASGLVLPSTLADPYVEYDEEYDEEYFSGCLSNLFSWCTSLKIAPRTLPAETLTGYCYQNMFEGCESLEVAPELLATTLATNCCENMFHDCIALEAAPELPAEILADFCYSNMFRGCESLTTAPETLPATTILGEACYSHMFEGCTSLVKAPNISATTLPDADDAEYGAFAYMFKDCTSLTAAPEALPATVLTKYCYSGMFHNCTSLITAPKLLAITLADGCCQNMFDGCESLEAIPELPATTLADYCYSYMFYGCSSLKLSAIRNDDCKKMFHIPSEGKMISIGENALDSMFKGTGYTSSNTWLDSSGTPVISDEYPAWAAYVSGPEAAPLSSLAFAVNPYKSQGDYKDSSNQGGLVADHTYKVTVSVPGGESSTYASLIPHAINGYDDIGAYYALGDSRTYGGTSYDEIPLTISYGRFKGDLYNYWVISTSLVESGGSCSITIQDETSGTTLIDSSSITWSGYTSYTSKGWQADCMYINIPRLIAGNRYTMTVNGTEYQHLELTPMYDGGYELGDSSLNNPPIWIYKVTYPVAYASVEYLYKVAIKGNVGTVIRVSISEEN